MRLIELILALMLLLPSVFLGASSLKTAGECRKIAEAVRNEYNCSSFIFSNVKKIEKNSRLNELELKNFTELCSSMWLFDSISVEMMEKKEEKKLLSFSWSQKGKAHRVFCIASHANE